MKEYFDKFMEMNFIKKTDLRPLELLFINRDGLQGINNPLNKSYEQVLKLFFQDKINCNFASQGNCWAEGFVNSIRRDYPNLDLVIFNQEVNRDTYDQKELKDTILINNLIREKYEEKGLQSALVYYNKSFIKDAKLSDFEYVFPIFKLPLFIEAILEVDKI